MLKTVTVLLCGVVIALPTVWAIAHWQDAEHSVKEVDQTRQDQQQGQQQNTRPRITNSRESDPAKALENKSDNTPGLAPFYAALEKSLASRAQKLSDVCSLDDPVARRVLEDYGAMFVAARSVQPPPVCVFESESEVIKFQSEAKFTTATIAGATIELQPAAMEALQAARVEAQKAGLNITPRGGREAARRTYADTLRLWNTRFLPGLTYWTRNGRISPNEAARIRQLPVAKQVGEVLELEKRGLFFSKDLSKSILYSIAAPGTSQHTAMLALDVTQFANSRVRRILATHGWFQTVKSDLPHFTFLGVNEKELPTLGLTSVTIDSQLFWVPAVVAPPKRGGTGL